MDTWKLRGWTDSMRPFEFVESKLQPPSPRSGIVPRSALVERLLAADAAPIISVVAPAGYGKTTLLAQWADRKAPRVGWVSVDQADNDPALLLGYIATAVDRVEPIDPSVMSSLTAPAVSVAATVVPKITAAVAAMRQSVGLVLDHVELLTNVQSLDAVAELAAQLPSGSQLALGSRARPPLPEGLLRAQGRMVEVGVKELAMDRLEARALLEAVGVRLAEAEVAELVGRTEGWPVGLYLAALARKAGGPRRTTRAGFAGDHRLMAGYLRSELLARLPQPTVSFLTRTSVLDRLSGPLCDAVLETRGSAGMLASLEASNLLVVPLDRRREWYRYHHLLRDLLTVELKRREPELVPRLHARAAEWFEANGLPEVAIDHAQAAGDADRVARLVWERAQPAYASGRADIARRWLKWFEDQGLIGRYPQIAVMGAEAGVLLGDPAAAERWAAVAERALADETLPDRREVEAELALVRAIMCRDGVERMRADAEFAWRRLDPGSTTRGWALLLQAISYLLDDEADRADLILAHAIDIYIHLGGMPGAAAATAMRSLVAAERQDWDEAETLAKRALEIVRDRHLDDYYIMSPLVHAVVARTALHRGDVARAREHLARAARLRPLLTYAFPHFAVLTLLELARGYLTLNDPAGTRTVLRQARDILQLRPDLGILPRRTEELRERLDAVHGGTVGPSSLTIAELRLLPLLSTHLSFKEIGERLQISRHTVKSQAIAVYRKLGVSSRGEAITRVHELGLLGS
jgi:LuxR family maltose regulon positive regulatory protein